MLHFVAVWHIRCMRGGRDPFSMTDGGNTCWNGVGRSADAVFVEVSDRTQVLFNLPFPVTRCRTGSRIETQAEVCAPPPPRRGDPVRVPTLVPGSLVGQRRVNEQASVRWGNA